MAVMSEKQGNATVTRYFDVARTSESVRRGTICLRTRKEEREAALSIQDGPHELMRRPRLTSALQALRCGSRQCCGRAYLLLSRAKSIGVLSPSLIVAV